MSKQMFDAFRDALIKSESPQPQVKQALHRARMQHKKEVEERKAKKFKPTT